MARTDFPIVKNVVNRLRKRNLREKLVDGTIDATMMGVGDTIRKRVGDVVELKTRRPR